MDRKGFFRASLGAGALSAGVASAEADDAVQTPAPLTPCDEKVGFARIWIKRFMDNLDREVEAARRIPLMEARGRSCARRDSVKAARECRGDVDKLVAQLAKWLGPDGAKREGQIVHVTYNKCLCPMVADVTEKISDTYCHCSSGWLKEMFETAGGKPVEVEILDTVKRGGAACRFTVRLEA
jgi:hypothetical protein